ncbi:MAG: hypothetical protein ACSLE6_12905, partial [Mycobacterium sp.]
MSRQTPSSSARVAWVVPARTHAWSSARSVSDNSDDHTHAVPTRFRSAFAYIAVTLDDDTTMTLMRLRYGGSANRWGFAIYLTGTGTYEDSIL